jgi:biopolymer transport protein ExbD
MNIRGRIRASAEIPQTSQADIAFLLLIFFIATTVFDTEVGIPLVLPGTGPRTVQVEQADLMTISSDERGALFVDGAPAELNSLHLVVQGRLRNNPNLIVAIETHPKAAYGVMIGVLDQVKLARADRISLRLRRDEEDRRGRSGSSVMRRPIGARS